MTAKRDSLPDRDESAGIPSALDCEVVEYRHPEDVAEVARLRAALEEIAVVEDTQLRCVRHGGEHGADDPETCWCGIALDAAEKARALAREALNGGEDR